MKAIALVCSVLVALVAVRVHATCESQPIDQMPTFPSQFSTTITIYPSDELQAEVGADLLPGGLPDAIVIAMDVDNVHNRTHIVTSQTIPGLGSIAIEAWGFVNADLTTMTVYSKVCVGQMCRCQREIQQLDGNASPDPWAHCTDKVYCGIGRSRDNRKCQVFEAACEGSDAVFCVNNNSPVEVNQSSLVAGVKSVVTSIEFTTFNPTPPAESVFQLPAICNARPVRPQPPQFTNDLPRQGPTTGSSTGSAGPHFNKRNVEQLSGADLLTKSTAARHAVQVDGEHHKSSSSSSSSSVATHHRNGEAHSSSPLPLGDRKHLAALERAMGKLGATHNPAHLHTVAVGHAQVLAQDIKKRK